MFPVKKKTNLRGDKKISAIIDYAIALLTVCMYLLNNYLIKNITTGITNRFFMCYFNDFLCPIVFLAYTNRLLAYVGKGLYNAGSITLLCGACGCVWEFVAPLINRKSVTDLFDMCAYCLGGVVYWTVHQVIKNGKK